MSQVFGSSGSGSPVVAPTTCLTVVYDLPIQNPTPTIGHLIRLRALSDFIPQEWNLSAMSGTDIEFDILVSSSGWPVFSSDSICNSDYPSLVSSSDTATGSATTWDTINKDDYIIITIRSGASIPNLITLQILGDQV